MPAPIKVELAAYSPEWIRLAAEENVRITAALGPVIITVHHVGSTAIPGICAKPILDLVPEVTTLDDLDVSKPLFERLGYQWWGEYGIRGRRYCTLSDSTTGQRLAQLHCFATGNPEIERHLAFRDYLRAEPDEALAYDQEKRRCREWHPDDSHAYTAAKAPWIDSVMPRALAFYRSKR